MDILPLDGNLRQHLEVTVTSKFSALISLMVVECRLVELSLDKREKDQLLLRNRLCNHPACDFTAQEICRTPRSSWGSLWLNRYR